eukprot:5825950-Amphidinium_carterae.1
MKEQTQDSALKRPAAETGERVDLSQPLKECALFVEAFERAVAVTAGVVIKKKPGVGTKSEAGLQHATTMEIILTKLLEKPVLAVAFGRVPAFLEPETLFK